MINPLELLENPPIPDLKWTLVIAAGVAALGGAARVSHVFDRISASRERYTRKREQEENRRQAGLVPILTDEGATGPSTYRSGTAGVQQSSGYEETTNLRGYAGAVDDSEPTTQIAPNHLTWPPERPY